MEKSIRLLTIGKAERIKLNALWSQNYIVFWIHKHQLVCHSILILENNHKSR